MATLGDLREQLEAVYNKGFFFHKLTNNIDRVADLIVVCSENGRMLFSEDQDAIYVAAKQYVIARDVSIQAAVYWKLQHK